MKSEKKFEIKKQFLIPACVLAVTAIGFIVYALGHPELSFPWSPRLTHIFYGLYADMVVLLFVLAFWKKTDTTYIYIGAVILELGAIYFLVQSIFTVIPDGESNWYLPVALTLNCIALCLNTVQRAKEKKDAS
ncbi:MAG: hypothetical protein Q4F24_01420 [Eubacteriales bacterium]|nr:hypothetical protein [Eubacteriales bacterium]